MRHGREPVAGMDYVHLGKSSLTWRENQRATGGTYRIERRRRLTHSLGQSARPFGMRCFVAGRLLTGGSELIADAETAPRVPPSKPTIKQGALTPTTRRRMSEEEKRLRKTLESYAHLTDNWDFEGAVAPPKEAVEDAISFLHARPEDIPLPLPEVAGVGDVGVYWDANGIFVEVQFGGDRKYSFYAERKLAKEVVEEYGEDGIALEDGWPEDMIRLLRRLSGSQSLPT